MFSFHRIRTFSFLSALSKPLVPVSTYKHTCTCISSLLLYFLLCICKSVCNTALLHWCLLDSVSSVETEGSSEVHEEEWKLEEEEDSEAGDLTQFNAFALPVSCGAVSGILYKSRFAGRSSELSLIFFNTLMAQVSLQFITQ